MNSQSWERIKEVILGNERTPHVSLIVDSPWIPDFADITRMEYYMEFDKWLNANMDLYQKFPNITFIPGFWMEYGMAAEPSGFGSRITWSEDSLPTPHPIVEDIEKISEIDQPNPKKDGLMPLILHNYRRAKKSFSQKDFQIKIVAARGPLAIASWVCGVTNLVKNIKKRPEEVQKLLNKTTTLVKDWLDAQIDIFDNVEGILLLDDIVGFLSPGDFDTFAAPYLSEIFQHYSSLIRFFHDDTSNFGILPNLANLDFEVFNFSHEMDISKVRDKVGSKICLMGNLPPMDVLAKGDPVQVKNETKILIEKIESFENTIISAGGGVAPDTPVENIEALSETVQIYNENKIK